MRLFLAAFVVSVVAGCASSLDGKSPEELALVSNQTLIDEYCRHRLAFNESASIRAEVKRRSLFTEDEWKAIDGRRVFVGMTEPAVWCSWGPPSRVNVTTTAAGDDRQLVWERPGHQHELNMVYVSGNRVTAIQQW